MLNEAEGVAAGKEKLQSFMAPRPPVHESARTLGHILTELSVNVCERTPPQSWGEHTNSTKKVAGGGAAVGDVVVSGQMSPSDS